MVKNDNSKKNMSNRSMTIYVSPATRKKLNQQTAFVTGQAGIPIRSSLLLQYVIDNIIDDNFERIVEHFKAN